MAKAEKRRQGSGISGLDGQGPLPFEPPGPGQPLGPGAEGEKILLLQRALGLLQKKRYPELVPLQPDGEFGPQMGVALQQFQALAGLPVTGRADEGTWQAVFSDVKPLCGRPHWPGAVLHPGCRGPQVIQLQLWLAQLANRYTALPPLAADGWLGPETEKGLRRFQLLFGLRPTGAADRESWDLLRRAAAGLRAGRPLPVAPRLPGEGAAAQQDLTALLQSLVGETLRAEDPGAAHSEPDGLWGEKTGRMLAAFCRRQALPCPPPLTRAHWQAAAEGFNRQLRGRT